MTKRPYFLRESPVIAILDKCADGLKSIFMCAREKRRDEIIQEMPNKKAAQCPYKIEIK